MTELNAETLANLQKTWVKIAASAPEQFSKNLQGLEDIIIGMKGMGLNMAHDSTYELLAPGLTRQEFRQKRTEMFMLQALDTYHGARHIGDNRADHLNRIQYGRMRQLLAFDLPSYETHVASSGLSDKINPALAQEINALCELKKTGKLDAELARLNIERAKDFFRTAYVINEEQEKEAAETGAPHYRALKRAYATAESAAKALDEAKGVVAPCDIPVASDDDGYWEDARVTFDRAAVTGLRDSLLLKTCGIEFGEIVTFQDQGHFVLDASGSGHGMMVLPVQRIVENLTEHKFDLNAPATFAAMGTTAEVFWAAYDRERLAVAKDPAYASRLAPEFKR